MDTIVSVRKDTETNIEPNYFRKSCCCHGDDFSNFHRNYVLKMEISYLPARSTKCILLTVSLGISV